MTNPTSKPPQSNKTSSNNPKKSQSNKPTTQKSTPRPATKPPIESPTDYPSLLSSARTLTPAESHQELLECARYGETDAVRAILEIHSSTDADLINAVDDGGNTALHKAAANGHESTVSLLLSEGAKHVPNENGATPLHWAAGGGKSSICSLLLNHYDAVSKVNQKVEPLDVLLKNSFGRSALTEAFTSGDTETVGVLLNHDSAEEERLIGGMEKEEVDAEIEDVKGKEEIVHEFDFTSDGKDRVLRSVYVRELPIAHPDNPFGQSPKEDTTGLSIWCASLIMARWLASPSMIHRLKNKHILELGAGCAVPSLAALTYSRPTSVTISDLNPETVKNIQYNVDLNAKKKCEIDVCSIDWQDETTYPQHKMDYVICSDCIYQKDIVPLLKKVIMGTLKPPNNLNENEGPSFLYVAPEGGRDGLPEFISTMKCNGFKCVKEEVAPDSFRDNPLKSGDEEECFLHFHELGSTTYVLYEFQRC